MPDKLEGFSNDELNRYSRHLLLEGFGCEGQQKLKNSSLLVVGAGGLGSAVLLYLAAAGIGTIGIVDFDTVSLNNLQRQVLFDEGDLGSLKTVAAEKKLRSRNSEINVICYDLRLASSNAMDVLHPFDLIVDASDNFPTRYLVNDACVLLNKPLVYGSISRFEGQVAVFNALDDKGVRGPNYRDLFPVPPRAGIVETCGEAGVFGALAGTVGSLQALEAIKLITGMGKLLSGNLLTIDLLNHHYHRFAFSHTSHGLSVRELIDYDAFCNKSLSSSSVKNVTGDELYVLMESNALFQLIDVRELSEFELVNLGGELKSVNELLETPSIIQSDQKVIMCCKTGMRSKAAIDELQRLHGFNNLYSLEDGIIGYIKKFRPDLPEY